MTYLEKKNELREALDGLHHQAVERDAVHAGHLLPLSTERDIKRFDSRKCTGISFVCLFVRLLFFFLRRNILRKKGARFAAQNRSTSEFPVEQVWACEWETEREVRKQRAVSHVHR